LPSNKAVKGVILDGFNMIALAAAIAGPTLCATRFNGKLNGVIAAIIPTGTLM